MRLRLPAPCLALTSIVAVAAPGCSTTERDENMTGSASVGPTTGSTASAGDTSAGSSDTAASSSGSGGETSGPKFDVGDSGETAGGDDGGGQMGCKKVDFLFVIDNSGSMAEEQSALIASFPKFIEAIKSTLDMAQDYHIMVVDTDAWVYEGCELLCQFGSCLVNPEYVCGQTQPLECEDVLGAGVTYPRGMGASNVDCMFSSGARYMDTTEQDLVGKFSCAARVGTGSTVDPEKPMEAMVAAVSGNGEVGACNQGFLRDDAILVVTFITDEDDDAGDGSNGTVEGWRQALIAAKNGDENAIVVLGLFGDQDLPNAICPPGDPNNGGVAEPSPRLRQFLDSWGDHGFFGSICASSYDEFFLDAVSIIDTTCDDFVPPQG
ncbi:MAG: hypothetical protein D6705_04270 [Deltaproteobacteria bacterium]|nr:MAG: hypothetical protein D6705_04270 [Deltaproteobacteria bacterium]